MPEKFKPSTPFTIGCEIELQLMDNQSFELSSLSHAVISHLDDISVKHELTRSMVEINSSVHTSVKSMNLELVELAKRLNHAAQQYGCCICGGGRHLTNDWKEQAITDADRYKDMADRFGYLSKLACVFGQHTHIGMESGDDAIYLCQALTPYLPHFIALSASSPFFQGIDTHFSSSRFSALNSFPNYGFMEELYNWEQFNHYFDRVTQAGVITSIKDIYWDIRPKADIGTIEIRVCDTPLTISHSTMLVGYAQMLARYLLKNREALFPEYKTFLIYNKINASRNGLQADYFDTQSNQHIKLSEHICNTINSLRRETDLPEELALLDYLAQYSTNVTNDADRIRQLVREGMSLNEVIKKVSSELFN